MRYVYTAWLNDEYGRRMLYRHKKNHLGFEKHDMIFQQKTMRLDAVYSEVIRGLYE